MPASVGMTPWTLSKGTFFPAIRCWRWALDAWRGGEQARLRALGNAYRVWCSDRTHKRRSVSTAEALKAGGLRKLRLLPFALAGIRGDVPLVRGLMMVAQPQE
jgi:hypothetical protein